MPLQPKLVFEGVDDALDPLADPTKRPPPVLLVAPVGADQYRTQLAHPLGEGLAGQALVGGDDRAWRSSPWSLASPSSSAATCRSPSFGLATHQADGMPSGAASKYSLRPQYQREWLRS
jgi:hypothetical protein